jgi:aryl-alcohol dehydrogenase-like predicted oxidoreductase
MKNLSEKICLGTAQFGLDYGINNTRGKIPKNEVFKILEYALQNGIVFIDTAYAYGDSEKVLGEFIKENPNGKTLKIISKIPNVENIDKVIEETFANLKVDKLYGYLVHNFNFFLENPPIYDILLKLKYAGKVEKIGFSLYYPEEYYKIKDLEIDILQIPYSIFDQRFCNFFEEFKDKKIEVHARSVFLQGLIFKKPEELKGKFSKLKDKLLYINFLSKELDIPLNAIFLNFVLMNENVDKVVIGIDSLEDLKENIYSVKFHNDVIKVCSKIVNFEETDEKIIIPIKWSKDL